MGATLGKSYGRCSIIRKKNYEKKLRALRRHANLLEPTENGVVIGILERLLKMPRLHEALFTSLCAASTILSVYSAYILARLRLHLAELY